MKKYIEQIKQRDPHERRQTALRFSLMITSVIFLGWFATLSLRLATPSPKTAETKNFESQLASIVSAFSLKGGGGQNTLEVASTTKY
jgi:hypothetical protein